MTYNHTKITVIFIFSEGKKEKKLRLVLLPHSLNIPSFIRNT